MTLGTLIHALIAFATVAGAGFIHPALGFLAAVANAQFWPIREAAQNGPPSEWGNHAWPEATVGPIIGIILGAALWTYL